MERLTKKLGIYLHTRNKKEKYKLSLNRFTFLLHVWGGRPEGSSKPGNNS